MFESILGWLVSAITKACAPVLDWLSEIIESDGIALFADLFPHASTLYGILQGTAIGIAIAIALINLIKFFLSPLNERMESPTSIPIRLFISIGLILFGGYILEYVVDFFKSPFRAIMDVSVTSGATFSSYFSVDDFIGDFAFGATITTSAKLLIELVAAVALIINIFKLMLELCERWLMVSVMVYTAPLGFSTAASQSTSGVFGKWVQMFISANIMVLISAWSTQMLVSILAASTVAAFPRLIFALTFCRLAQKFDSYIQTLGVNVAATSGNLLHELAGTATAMITGSKLLRGNLGGGNNGSSGNRSEDVLGARNHNGVGLAGAGVNGIPGAVAATGANTILSGVAGLKRGWQDTLQDYRQQRYSNKAAGVKQSFSDATKVWGSSRLQAVKNGGQQAWDNIRQSMPGQQDFVKNKMEHAYANYGQPGYDNKLTYSERRAVEKKYKVANSSGNGGSGSP